MNLAIQIVILLFSIIIHEVSHGFAAYLFGDRTAKLAGRLSLNPLKHIDPIGSVILPALLKLSNASFIFGYAKPVPINPDRFSSYKMGMICVALAGPLSNLVLAGVFAAMIGMYFDETSNFYIHALTGGLAVNCALFLFNMLPILPLDGGRIVVALTPAKAAETLSKTEPFGILVVMGICMLTPYLEREFGIPLDFMKRTFFPALEALYMFFIKLAVPI
ncbi:MAG: site-2 protease family protein [Holosporales bacterium]|jgi:Zn-dependent protease|nr:site-2 protease family protein [Holosporales bacterium]